MTVHIGPDLSPEITSQQTPEHVLKAIVDGINAGDLDALMRLCRLRLWRASSSTTSRYRRRKANCCGRRQGR